MSTDLPAGYFLFRAHTEPVSRTANIQTNTLTSTPSTGNNVASAEMKRRPFLFSHSASTSPCPQNYFAINTSNCCHTDKSAHTHTDIADIQRNVFFQNVYTLINMCARTRTDIGTHSHRGTLSNSCVSALMC